VNTFSEQFENKNILVTGGASGIGQSVCEKFHDLGANVICLDTNLVENKPYKSFVLDVANENDIKNFYKITKLKEIATLVNCAGITKRANVLDTSLEEWNKVISVNLTGTFLMCKYALPFMSSGSTIVNIASGWGIVGGKNAVSYCASKGGIVLLTKAMALDHAQDGIRINSVCPGDTKTNLLKEEARQLGLNENQLIDDGVNRPLGRVGNASEIADSVLFLASSYSSFITGQEIIVDGGSLAGSQ